MQSGANFLVLDEPTNHLDIDSVEMLEDAIERYDGTVVFSSHDRYFLDRIADRTLEVKDGAARAYEGGYSSWYARTGGLARASPDRRQTASSRARNAPAMATNIASDTHGSTNAIRVAATNSTGATA